MDFARHSQPIPPGVLILPGVALPGPQSSPGWAQSPPFADEQPSNDPSPEIARKLKRVETQCAAGNVPGALQTAYSISDPLWRDWAIGTVILSQARATDYASAIRTVARMQSVSRQVNLLTIIAALQNVTPNVPKAEVDKTLAKALITAERIPRGEKRDAAWERVALAYLQRSNIPTALTLVRRMQTPTCKVYPLIEIARQQVATGKYREARQTAGNAFAILNAQKSSYGRDVALRGIVQAQLTSGDLAAALKSALLMETPSDRANWLAQVGYHVAHAGDRSNAHKIIQEARKSFSGIQDGYYRDVVRAELVIALVEARHVAEAKQIFAEMYDPQQKARAKKALDRVP